MDPVASQTSALTPTNFAASAGGQSAQSSSNTLSADFETFLQLLTTQMKNQDPTNPQDSTEFISQLASFSAVEQQVETNLKLQELVDSMTSSGMSSLSTWIGADVRSAAAAKFDGAPIEVSFTPPQDAQSAYVSVKDDGNVEIAKIAVSPGDVSTTWDGTDFTGAAAPEGSYSFSIIGVADGTVISTQAAETYSRVTEARSENGEIFLIFPDGTRMRANDVDFARTALSET